METRASWLKCCEDSSVAPDVNYQTATTECRYAGFKHDAKLWRTQVFNVSENFNYGIVPDENYSGDPGDLTEPFDPGDHGNNQLVYTGFTGDAVNAFYDYIKFDVGYSATISRTSNEKTCFINSTEQGQINPVVPVISNLDSTAPSPAAAFNYEVYKYGRPATEKPTEPLNINGTTQFAVLSNPQAAIIFDNIVAGSFEVKFDMSVTGSHTFTNGLTITASGSNTEDDNPSLDKDTDADYSSEIDADFVFAQTTQPTPADEDYNDSNQQSKYSSTPIQYNSAGYYNYIAISKKWLRFRFEIPSDFEGSYYEIEYKILDQAGNEVEKSKVEWNGPGNQADPQSYFTDFIYAPNLSAIDEEHTVIPLRYRCYHNSPWHPFS